MVKAKKKPPNSCAWPGCDRPGCVLVGERYFCHEDAEKSRSLREWIELFDEMLRARREAGGPNGG